jgi:hypothetical protein
MKEPISGQELIALCAHAEKTIESKGLMFYVTSYMKGLRDAEKYHGISVPTHTTRESRSKKDEYGR